MRDETGEVIRLIWVFDETEYFSREGLDRLLRRPPVGQISRTFFERRIA